MNLIRQLAQQSPASFPLAGGVFTVRRGPTLVTLVLFALLMALGFWQVERLAWKEQLIHTISTRIKQLPQDVRSLSPLYWHADGRPDSSARIAVEDLDYRPASAIGQFLYGAEMFLTSTSQTGEGGYQVLTPMQLEDGRWLLVDRGWIPYSRKPDANNHAAAGFARPTGVVQVAGLLRVPAQRWLQPANKPATGEWYGIDLPTMAQAAGISGFLPFVLYADADPNAGGFPVGGQTRLDIPNNHLVYSLIWFGIAAGLLTVYFIASWTPPPRAKPALTKITPIEAVKAAPAVPETVAAAPPHQPKAKRGKPAWVAKLFDPPPPPPKPPLFPRPAPAVEAETMPLVVKPKRGRRKKAVEAAPANVQPDMLTAPVSATPIEAKPVRRRRKKVEVAPENGAEAASTAAPDIGEVAPAKKPRKPRKQREAVVAPETPVSSANEPAAPPAGQAADDTAA